jgi:hypothetical protein
MNYIHAKPQSIFHKTLDIKFLYRGLKNNNLYNLSFNKLIYSLIPNSSCMTLTVSSPSNYNNKQWRFNGRSHNTKKKLIWRIPSEYRKLLKVQFSMGMKLITHLHLVPWSRIVKLYLHFPMHLHGMVLNWLSTGTTLPCLTILANHTKSSVRGSCADSNAHLSPIKVGNFLNTWVIISFSRTVLHGVS